MPNPFDAYPYSNFHELNLDYFIREFQRIFAEWHELYETMTGWKDATDAELAAWKTSTLADMSAWETALLAQLDAWKTATGTDITDWETGVLSDLDDWKDTFTAYVGTITTDAEAARDAAAASATAASGSATAAAGSATAAAGSATAAASSAAAAAAAAASIELDATLTSPTKAAQAKATGDAIAALEGDVSETIEEALYNVSTEDISFTSGANPYTTNGPYYMGVYFPAYPHAIAILPEFVDEIATYQYAIWKFDTMTYHATNTITVIKDWTTVEVDTAVELDEAFFAANPYAVVMFKSTSQISCGSNPSAYRENYGLLQARTDGYINVKDVRYMVKSTVTVINRDPIYLTRSEYESDKGGWDGKTIGIIGDSFTALGNWPAEMAANLGATVISKALSAQSFHNQEGRSAYKQAQLFVTDNPGVEFDAFIIAMGTNDQSQTITAISDVNTLSQLTAEEISTYTGGMQACIMYLQEHYPNARILLGWTPANGYWSSGTYADYTAAMDLHVAKMKEVAEWYGIEYIETRTCGFTRKNTTAYSTYWGDDNHPNTLGHHKIAQYMTMLMRSLGGYVDVQT